MNLSKTILTIFLLSFWIFTHAQSGTDSTDFKKTANYKPDILSVVQFAFTENGLGLGMSYERAIDKRGMFAFYMPAIVTFDIANSNRIYDYNTGNYNTGKADAMFYAMPGVKFYPTGSYGRIKYATGASLVVASGQKSSDLANYNGLNITEQVQHHFLTGLMWQNSLNVNLDKRTYIGAEAGLGQTFMDRVGDVSVSNEVLVNGALKIGFRF